jgi:hypothetical protein
MEINMANNLITLQEYKTYAGINSVEQDAKISSLIASVSALIKTYCSRSIVDYYASPMEQYFDGEYSRLLLTEYPIKSVLSLGYSVDYGVTYTELTQGTNYVVDKATDTLVIVDGVSRKGVNALKVTYFGGYETAPDDLKLAALDLVQYYTKSENNPKKVNGFVSVEYVMSADFPSHIKRVLDLYRTW